MCRLHCYYRRCYSTFLFDSFLTFKDEVLWEIIFILLFVARVWSGGIAVKRVAAGHRRSPGGARGAPPFTQAREVPNRELKEIFRSLLQNLECETHQQVGQTRRNLRTHPGAMVRAHVCERAAVLPSFNEDTNRSITTNMNQTHNST